MNLEAGTSQLVAVCLVSEMLVRLTLERIPIVIISLWERRNISSRRFGCRELVAFCRKCSSSSIYCYLPRVFINTYVVNYIFKFILYHISCLYHMSIFNNHSDINGPLKLSHY